MNGIPLKTAGLLTLALAAAALPLAAEPVSTAFTYQGSLKKADAPVSAPQDFQFGLYSTAAGTDQVGSTVTLAGVPVTNGLFNVNLDFGTGAFGTDQRYLQIAVRPTGQPAYTTLAPRAPVMPAPVALTVATGGVSNAAIQGGAITREKLAPSITSKLVTFLPYDFSFYNVPVFPPFVPRFPSDDLQLIGDNVRVNTTGIYAITTHLTVLVPYAAAYVDAKLTLNNATLKVFSTSSTRIESGSTLISGLDILELHAGDLVSVKINSMSAGVQLKGDADRSTTFDIVRLD